jgi:hypothetical protein
MSSTHWRAVEIGPDGWRVNKCPLVRFRRPVGILPPLLAISRRNFRVGPCFKSVSLEMGLRPHRIQHLEDYRCQFPPKKVLCVGLFLKFG